MISTSNKIYFWEINKLKIKEKLTIKIKNASKKVIEELKKEGHEVQLISNSVKNSKKEE